MNTAKGWEGGITYFNRFALKQKSHEFLKFMAFLVNRTKKFYYLFPL